MRYFVALILGLVAGAALGLAGIYYNPLTAREPVPVDENRWTLGYLSPVSAGLALTHGGGTRLPAHPAGVPELWENTIEKMALSVFRVTSLDGATGIASRLSFPSERSELLRRGLILTDQWLITIPGEGSLFVDADSNVWPFVKRDVLPVWYLDRAWRGPHSFHPTVGPGADGAALVHGATGRFAGREGSAAETYHVSAFNAQRGPDALEAELIIDLPEPAPIQASD